MRLTVYLPTEVFLDEETVKVVAEGPQGSFCLLPRHIDLVTPLVPSILAHLAPDGEERFLAVDGGILTKQGARVRVATRTAVAGTLGSLRAQVEELLAATIERDKVSRSAVARLEAGFLKRFMSFSKG